MKKLLLLLLALPLPAFSQTTAKGLQWDTYVQGDVPAVGFRFYEVREDLARVLLKSVTLAEAPASQTQIPVDLSKSTRIIMTAYAADGAESDPSNEVIISAEKPLPPQSPRAVTFFFNEDGTLNRVEVDP